MSNKTFKINSGDFIRADQFSKEQLEEFCQLANSINNGYRTGEWMRWYGELDYLGVENNRIYWGDYITNDRKDITAKFKQYLQEENMNIKCIPEQGDYVSVKDMKEYAASKGKTLQQVYALVYNKFIQAGAESGEGLKHMQEFTLDNEVYGWSKTSGGMFFSSDGGLYMYERLTNKISVAALLEDKETMNNNFSKKDLRNGMLLTLRSGELRYVLKGSTWQVNGNMCVKGADLTDYCQDLLIKVYPLGGRNSDIVKVTDRDGKVLYVRQEEPIELTLEQVAEKFGLDVKHVRIKHSPSL